MRSGVLYFAVYFHFDNSSKNEKGWTRMNKKVNTLLFILGATLLNVLVTLLSFGAFTLIYVKFILTSVPEQSRIWIFALIFIAALMISFFVYRIVLRFLMKKVQIDKYFDPIFGRRNIRKS